MSLDLNLGAAFDTAVDVDLAPWLPTALKVMSNDGTLIKAADVLSPLDKQAVVKITNTRIANVYNTLGKGVIPIGNQAVNTSGQSIFAELTATASETIDTVEVLSPLVARIEVRLPNNGSMTDANVLTLVMATLASMCDADGTLQVLSMMRGVLFPVGNV